MSTKLDIIYHLSVHQPAMKTKESFVFPLPGCSSQESRIIRQLIIWEDEYQKKKFKSAHAQPPTTERCTEHFNFFHKDMLLLLNRLESRGLVNKQRRQSAGLFGKGYDGSLHSSVLPTDKARELVAYNRD